ncbi:MAG: lysylphosphatidylglycerol synthase domain-containing protein [Betaproteobacteria bacterium]
MTQYAWWPWVRRGLTLAFFCAVALLLIRYSREVEWGAVWKTVRANTPTTLMLAAALTVVSHGLFASFDLIGRNTTGHRLSVPRVLSVAWVSYVFNLNLGALLGGAGFRFRLYSQLGLDKGVIAQVYGLSVVTNWLGLTMLLGGALLLTPIALPDDWQLGHQAQTILGVVLPLVALAYLVACFWMPGRSWHWRAFHFTMPSGRTALIQQLLSSLNWLVVAGVITILLRQQVAYTEVVGVTLLAAVAGVVIHVPGGLGVLEAVFVVMLGSDLPRHDILGALLAYRALYYLAPLVLAVIVFAVMEAGLRKHPAAHPASNVQQPAQ